MLIADTEAARLLEDDGVDYSRVVRAYLTAKDLADHPEQAPSRWVIDFGLMSLEQAMGYPRALEIVRGKVKPTRETPAQRN